MKYVSEKPQILGLNYGEMYWKGTRKQRDARIFF